MSKGSQQHGARLKKENCDERLSSQQTFISDRQRPGVSQTHVSASRSRAGRVPIDLGGARCVDFRRGGETLPDGGSHFSPQSSVSLSAFRGQPRQLPRTHPRRYALRSTLRAGQHAGAAFHHKTRLSAHSLPERLNFSSFKKFKPFKSAEQN